MGMCLRVHAGNMHALMAGIYPMAMHTHARPHTSLQQRQAPAHVVRAMWRMPPIVRRMWWTLTRIHTHMWYGLSPLRPALSHDHL